MHIAVSGSIGGIPANTLWQVLRTLGAGEVGVVTLCAVQPDLLGGELAVVRANLDVVVAEDNVEVLAAGDVLAGEGQAP